MTDFSRKTLTDDRILQCDSTINTFKPFIHLFIYSFVHLSIYGSPAARAARMRAMAGYQRRRGSRVHMAVDTLGCLLAVHVTPADEQERAQVRTLYEQVQYRLPATGHTVELAWADQGYTGGQARQAAQDNGIDR